MFASGAGAHISETKAADSGIGREAVRASLRSIERMTRKTRLKLGRTRRCEPWFKSAPRSWGMGPAKSAYPKSLGLFPDVIAEPIRKNLLGKSSTRQPSHLRSLVEIASKRIGSPDCRKSLSGSVASHPVVRELVGLKFEEPRHHPNRGAEIWARQHLLTPGLKRRLQPLYVSSEREHAVPDWRSSMIDEETIDKHLLPVQKCRQITR